MKIKAEGRQWHGGGYYRVTQPLDELAKHGHETSYALSTLDQEPDGADVFVGQIVGGSNHAIVHAWWRNIYRQCPMVYEIDDDLFEIEQINPAWQVYGQPLNTDSIRHCIEISNLVTVSTDVLAERISKINPNVVVLQNRIDESMLTMQRLQRDRLTIGWAGGESHIMDLKSVARPMKRIMEWHKQVDFKIIGADLRFLLKTPRPILYTPFVNDTLEYYKLIDFDIGIAPLVPTVFAEAKSHIKALEFSALGIPVVASDTAPYRDFVIDGVTGFLIKHDHEWTKRLGELIHDDAMRLEMGVKARELASQWTIQQGWQEWEQAYKGIMRQ
jgi:glycosyltransferase involved in cell wall biosynthesis